MKTIIRVKEIKSQTFLEAMGMARAFTWWIEQDGLQVCGAVRYYPRPDLALEDLLSVLHGLADAELVVEDAEEGGARPAEPPSGSPQGEMTRARG